MTNSQSVSNKPSSQPAATTATVGVLLRETRKRAGIGIADVARALRISQKYLEALEDDRHADLPGAAYAIGFVRSYGEHLHLDGEEVVRRYKVEAAGLNGKKDLVFPKPMSDSGVPGGAVLGLGVVFAALAYGLWYWNSNEVVVDGARVETVPEYMASATDKASGPAPESTSAATSTAPEGTPESTSETALEAAALAEETSELAPKASVAPESPEDISSPQDNPEDALAQALKKPLADVDAAPKAEAQVAESAANVAEKVADQAPSTPAKEPLKALESVPSVDKTPPVPVRVDAAPVSPVPVSPTPVAVAPTASAPTVSAPTAPAPASTEPVPTAERQNEGPSRITVRALSNSWIQVRDEVADRLLFTRLLRKGDEYKVPNRSGLRLMTGNAGALELRVDDVAAPSIGAIGEVRRSVELDVVKLKAGTAVSE